MTNGGVPLTVTGAVAAPVTVANQLTVTYTVAPADNLFDGGELGTWAVALEAGQVEDGSGQSLTTETALGNFTVAPDSTSLGIFGAGAPKGKLSFFMQNGVKTMVTLKGGSGEAFETHDGRLELRMTGTSIGSKLTIAGKGSINLANVTSDGTISVLTAKTASLSGTLWANGWLEKVTLGSISGGTLAAADSIDSLKVTGATTAGHVLAGVNLGTDLAIGGTGAASDTFEEGSIWKRTAGGINDSIVAAGVNPVNGIFGDGTDAFADRSFIGSITPKGGLNGSSKVIARVLPFRESAKEDTDPRGPPLHQRV